MDPRHHPGQAAKPRRSGIHRKALSPLYDGSRVKPGMTAAVPCKAIMIDVEAMQGISV